MTSSFDAGFDIGGTAIKFGLVDRDGRLVRQGQVRSPGSIEGILAALEDAWTGLKRKAPGPIRTCGFGIAGFYSLRQRKVLQSPNCPSLDGYPLVQAVRKFIDVPVRAGNDANMAAFGEFKHGAGRDVRSLVLADRRDGHRLGPHPRRQALAGRGRLRRRDRPHHGQSRGRALQLRRPRLPRDRGLGPEARPGLPGPHEADGRHRIARRSTSWPSRATRPPSRASGISPTGWASAWASSSTCSIPRRSSSAAGSFRPGTSCSGPSSRRPAGGPIPSPSRGAGSRGPPWATGPAWWAPPPGPATGREAGDERGPAARRRLEPYRRNGS